MRQIARFGCGPTSTNMAGYGAAVASLEDDAHIERSRKYVQQARSFFENELRQMGLRYMSGPPTFLLVEIGQQANDIREALVRKKIYVRQGEEWALPRHLRISYGLDEEHRAFFDALRSLLA
jgi:histidinol-phosphate aminotransferase